MNDNLKNLYNTLVSSGYNPPAFDQFVKDMQDEKNLRGVYSTLQKEGYTPPSFDRFKIDMGYQAQKPQQPATGAQPVVKPATGQVNPTVNASVQPKQEVQTAQQTGWKPTWQQQMGMQMQIDGMMRQTEQSQRDFNARMENMRKGTGLGTFAGEVKPDAATGKLERKFYTTRGDEVGSQWEQSRLNLKYRDEWEATTEEGRKHRERRMEEARRRQVEDLSGYIDNALADAKGRSVEQYNRYATEHPFMSAMLSAAGAASPGDMQRQTYEQVQRSQHIPSNDARQLHNEIVELEAAQRSMRDAKRIISEADHNAQKGTFGKWLESSFAGGAARGAVQKLFDVDTWDFGGSDMSDAGALMTALRAYDNGEQLTRSQQALLDAKAVELSTDAYFGSEVGRGYKAGKVTAESIPFMLEMCINPASGFGHSASSIMTRYALKRFGKQAVKNNVRKYVAAKVGARVAGDIAGAATMAATSGSIRTGANAIERMNGDVQFDTDNTGKSVFAGHSEGEDAGTAVAKAFASTTIENYSEMVGEYFAPVLGAAGKYVRKGMGKIGLGSVGKFIDDVAAGDVAKLVKDFEKHSKWNGMIGEYAEEVAGGIMNALVVGDQTLDADPETGVFNLDNNIDTFLGVALMGGFMSSVKALGYRTPKYRAEQQLKRADDAALQVFGGDQNAWGELRNTLAFGNDEDVTSKLAEVSTSSRYSDDMRLAVFEYAEAVERYKGFLKGSEKYTDEEETEKADTDKNEEYVADEAQRFGYEADSQERNDIAIEVAEHGDAEATEAWNGVVARINDEADAIAAQKREQGRKMRHSDGSFRPATLKEKDENGHDKQVYVVEGNVVMMPDGTMVDAEKSDKSVVIYDPATGERRMVSPAADTGILSLGEVTSAEDYEAGIEQNRQRFIQEQTDNAQGKVVVQPGKRVVMPNGEEATVMGIFGDGGVSASTDDGRVLTASHEELQRIADERALSDYRERHGIADEQQNVAAEEPAEEPRLSENVQGAPAEYIEGVELSVRDEDGTEKHAMVMGRVRYENGQLVPDANGNIVEYLIDGEVKHDRIDKLNEKVVSHVPAKVEAEVEDNGTKEDVVEQPQTDEEKVISEGVAAVGEGLRDAVNEQAEGIRENDINSWLQKPSVAEAMRKYGEGAKTPEEVVQRALADNPTDETRAALNDILRFDSSKQLVQGYISQPQDAAPHGEVQPTADAMPMVGSGDDAEPDFMRTTPQRGRKYIYEEAGLGHDKADEFVSNNIEAASRLLDKAKRKVPKMGTSLAKYKKDKAAWEQQVSDAQAVLGYWKSVKNEQDMLVLKEREAQRERDIAAHDAAVAQSQADYEDRKRAEAERKTVGNGNPMPAITEKWNNAEKIDGHRDEIVLPNGERIKGHYVLHESGAPSPSHNPQSWAKTEGFPMDANDNSVNDRDYEQDTDAQQVTRNIARRYDQRALQTPVVVSQDGVVLSGNGRTMAGELAARDNTDGAYIGYLKEYARKYGFTPEQVGAMQHPRVSFVPDERMPYTAETFSKFNQQEMKSQNKTEHAVKLGKTVSDDTFKRIVRTINGFDTLGEFYADGNASLGAVYELRNAGVVPQAQLAEMVDGVRGQEKLSAVGREFLENMLIGKAFAGSPEVVRMLTAVPSMRQSVITALGEISDNIALGKGYSLQDELAEAVKLVFNARTDGRYQHGDIVSMYAKQGVLFADPDQLQTVADFNNATMLMLADVLNDRRVTLLKTTLALYNNDARLSAEGVQDMFENGVRSRESILKDVINFINNNYGRNKEIEAARAAAVERRKADSVQQDGSAAESSGEGATDVKNGNDGRGGNGSLAGREQIDFAQTEEIDENGLPFVKAPDGTTVFGEIRKESGLQPAPIRLSEGFQDEDGKGYGLAHIEANHGEQIRNAGFSSVEDFVAFVAQNYDEDNIRVGKRRDNGNTTYLIQVQDKYDNTLFIEMSRDGSYWNVNSAGIFRKGYSNKKETVAKTEPQQPTNAVSDGSSLSADDESGISPAEPNGKPTVSDSKGNEKGVGSQGFGAENSLQEEVSAAEADVNTSPTEAQKEAGNYKKGHVRIDGFDVSIEQPKGSVRRGTDADGKQWEHTMNNTYGYLRGTEGVDGDHIDVFLSDDPSQGDVFVVDQVNGDGSFDEHKVMYGFADEESARRAYLANYEDGWTGLGAITRVTKDEFKKWVESSHRKTKPFAEYKGVKKKQDVSPTSETSLPVHKDFAKYMNNEAGTVAMVSGDGERGYVVRYYQDEADVEAGLAIGEVVMTPQEFKAKLDSGMFRRAESTDPSVSKNGDQVKYEPYTIEPTTYTNKKGKTTPMHIVTFGRELTKEEIRAGKELAKESRGWWDREKGGFMMRSEDAAKELAETLAKGDEETIADAQPLSVGDMAAATDAADLQTIDEAIKVEQEPQTTPQYDYDREDNVYETTLYGLHETLANSNGGIPNVKAIEKQIRDLRKKAKTIEDGMATAAGETIPQAFDALANLTGKRRAYEQFLSDIRKKMAETERDDALAAHGVNLGDKIMYKGKEVTIHDADARQVTLDVGLAPVLYEVTDWENVEVPKREPATPQPKKVNVESLMGELNEKGEAKLNDHIEEPQQEESTEQPKQEEKKAKSKWVDDADAERFEELRRRLRQKLGGQLNMGVDPEAFALGVEMSYLMLKHGARKFAEFAKQMIEALGENVRPYLKSFYNGARDLPEMAEYEKELTPYDEVRTFDVMNFDKEGAKDIIATAEHIVREQAAEREAKEATDKLKQERNEQRKETEQEVAANTEALASEAATVASEVESKLPSARSERELNDLAKSVDDAVDKVNDQLALLGYYEAEPVKSDFNEAYGYMRNAEKKAVKNVTELFKTLVKELGISDPVVYDAKGKKQKSVTANIAPAGGEVTMRIMLNRDKGVELYISFSLYPDYENNRDNLVLRGIMFRPERNLPNGGREYLGSNDFFPVDVTVPQMLHGIRSVCREWLPKEDYVAMAQRIAAENADSQQEKQSKARKSKKKTVSSQEYIIPDLFSGLLSEEENSLEPQNKKDNGLQRIHAVRSEGLPAGGNQQGEHIGRRSETSGQESRGTDRRGEGDSVRTTGRPDRHVSQLERSAAEPPSTRSSKPEPAPLAESERKNTHNNTAERGTDYAPKGTSARIEANIKAIETMQRLVESGEPATPEDMSVLRKFSGWGGLGAAFKEKLEGGWGKPNPDNVRLRELLSPEAYEAANMSRNSAYYTPAPVIDAMWDVARAMGFRGGNVLEGSAGIGNIIGLMPTDMSERSNIHAVEIDETTGNILSLLYPDAHVEVKGFEKTFVPNGSVDLAITNVPFVTGLRVMDETGDKDLSRKFHDIHDFCIAKNVRKLKEGGVGIFITSSGTLDSPNSAKLRTWLVNEGGADVVGAFRMHNQTFGGTGATSDIIVIRKRVNGRKSANAIDVSGTLPIRTVKYNTGKTKRGSSEVIVKDLALDVNKHFVEHPEDMAGEMAFAFEKGDTYRATSKALYPSPSINQEQRLSEWAQQFKDMDWDKAEERESQQVVYEDLGEDVKEGSMLLDSDGNLCLAQRGKAVPINVNANKVKGHTKAECFKAYKAIKDALADVLEYQTTHSDDSGLRQRLAKLNKAYDSFVKTYGHLNKNTSISFLRSDMDYPSIAALESVSETGDKSGKRIVTYGKTDIFSRRVVETESEPKPTTIKDGIIASIYLNGRVDVPYIAEQLNMSEGDVRQQVIESGLGFENPTTTEMEVSYEYLSGNVREKLRQAQENNTDGRYDANIKALERVVPMNIPAHLIEFTLGSSWVEPKLYEDFVKERTGLDVKLTNAGGTWIMSEPYYTTTEQNKAMGVISEKCDKTILGHELIKAAITCKSISVTKTISTGYGSSKTTETIVDKEATMACANKIDEIRQDFKDWARGKVQGDPEMSERMERVYNELFNNSVPKEIPDEFVPEHFGGAATVVNGEPFKLRPHQAKAVIRATTQPLMLAHEVGSGKTYTLISTAMEMRRLGTARKPMIVVQNSTVGQFVSSAKEIYPNAKILTLEDIDRNADGRRNFYAKIRYNDWDMIIVPQSVFQMIPDSEEREIRFVEDKIEEKMAVLEKMREAADNDRDPVLRQAQRELEQLEEERNNLQISLSERKGKTEKDEKREAKTRQNAMVKAQEMLDRETDDVANFDDMGIDALLIDEAHEYKHLGFATAMQRGVKGVDPSYSKKSQGVYLKTQAVLENKNGKNVVFATGTPISNTAAEIWTFMRYLMPADTMREYGIYYFDDFVRNFGNIQQMLEFSTNGKYKENNRFSGYVNLPELVRIWSSITDTKLNREIEQERIAEGGKSKIPEMEGGKAQDIYLPQTKALRSVMKFVKDQLDDFENMSGKEKKENSHIPLTMYGIAQAAAVDPRLVLEDAADDPNSKTNEAVRQTLRSLEDTKEYNGTVAIFSDRFQNNSTGFNLYDDIRQKLIAAGVPETQVVVVNPRWSVKKKLEIFDKVNRGEVRVIMGSTATLGTGVNIQERLHTLIHVDAPNRPMDYTQRNGRILRQGNLHNEWGIPVRVLRFGVEDSLDVTAYQRLKTKGAIADSIMEGKKMMGNSMENRVLEEEQDLFGDITAQLSGSQYALLKNQVEKEVKKLEARKKQWEADQTYVHNQKPRLRALIKDSEERARRNKEALAKVEAAKNDGITIGKMKFPSLDAMGDYIKDYNSKQREQQEQVRKASDYKAEAKSDLTVSIGGFDFHIHRVISKEQKQEKGQLSLFIFSKTQMTYSCPELGLEDVPVDGQRLKSALEDILNNVMSGDDFREKAEYADRAAERYKGELQQVEARDGKPFEYADELKQAKEKLAEYEELMKAEMAEKEAKYAEMDASVEAATGVQLTEEDSEDVTEDSALYRTSEDLTEEYGDRWLTEQTNDDGRHTTQVKNTINSYKKFGEWVKKDSRGREVSVLDASSGLGLGTQWMRENGMSVDDVEPYPSADRMKPTFGSYAEISKKYDYIISNAVLNVIPDDWRTGLLHDMADKLKPGGKLVINVRGAESIRRQGKEGVTRITLDDPSEILVLRPDGSIKAYQKGFTKDELQDWCEEELGDGYTVLKASRDNAGGTYDTAVVVVKNNESTAKGSASELGQPTESGAAVANFAAMVGNNSERAKRLGDLSAEIGKKGSLGSHQLLHEMNVALDLSVTREEGVRMSTEHSRYYDLGNGVSLRISDHQGNADTFARVGHPEDNFGIVIKLSRSRFKDKDGVDYLEYVYYGDRVDGRRRQMEIVDGLRAFVETGDLSKLPRADKVNGSGRFKDAALPQQTERSSSAKRLVVEELAEKLDTDIHIIEDVNEITHPDAAVQARRRRSKGWYDAKTGQVVVVLPNNRDVEDAKATAAHETIAHKGLRELVGEERYGEFLDEVYGHLREDLKKGVDAAAGRAFVDDATRNGKRAKSYEQHRRRAVDELFGRLAEKPFEEFSEGERTLWQKLKAAVRKLIDRFLGSLKLPKWFELGDNELRYMLWRSKERLERGKEHPIDAARDIVKREELGLTDEARYNMGDAPETFTARQKRAVENKGTVMPGLNDAQVKVIEVPRHDFTGTGKQALASAEKWAKGNIAGIHSYVHDGMKPFDYKISNKSIDKYLSSTSVNNSENMGVHLSVLKKLPDVISESIETEEHADYSKGNDGKRSLVNPVNKKELIHRFYGSVSIDGKVYRVKTTIKEYSDASQGAKAYNYEVTKIELIEAPFTGVDDSSNLVAMTPTNSISVAKLLQNVEKSYDNGKKLLDESKLADESTDLYRDPEETEDIWNDQSMGLQERITAAATRLANNHREDKTLRNDAMRAIGGNLADLRKAMSLQRTFDMTTVKRVADLARVLISGGYIGNATSGEVKRLLSAVKNSVGRNDIILSR